MGAGPTGRLTVAAPVQPLLPPEFYEVPAKRVTHPLGPHRNDLSADFTSKQEEGAGEGTAQKGGEAPKNDFGRPAHLGIPRRARVVREREEQEGKEPHEREGEE